MERISKHQLFCLILIGQIGSTNLWALGIEAKQDAWIAVLVSMVGGLGLVWLYTELQGKYPNDNLAGIIESILGKVIGWPLVLIYTFLYIFNATRNTSEFGDLINMTFLQETPHLVINFIFLATIIYILFLGIETLARVAEIVLPLILIMIIGVYIMVVASGRMDLKQLTPVLGNGVMPVVKVLYPVGINFPFGLGFVFMQFWRYTDSKPAIRKTALSAVTTGGFILTFTLIIMITTLGTQFAADATIPFLEVIKLINIGDIITNLDAVGVLLIFIGGFFLAVLNIASAALLLSTLFKVQDFRWFLIPLGIFILWYTNVYETNYPSHVKYLVPQFWQQFVPLFNIVPILLLMIYWLKNCSKRLKSRS